MKDRHILFMLAAAIAAFAFAPIDSITHPAGLASAASYLREYARYHIFQSIIPAFFIAGAISVFIKKDSVLRYLGPDAKKHISYGIAAVSGAILTVCSCTILPLFAGIRKRGAGLGPAITFLFSGPAINVAAIFLTASVLGTEMATARITAAITLSILAGLTMQAIFRESAGQGGFMSLQSKDPETKPLTIGLFFAAMLMIIASNSLSVLGSLKSVLMLIFALFSIAIARYGLKKQDRTEWLSESWRFMKMILPILFIGVFIAGFIVPYIPPELIAKYVGQNTIQSNLIASVIGAFMYFSTLTEIPIIQTLMGLGMGKGPALALLLAGPSLSIPNMLVIRRVLGNKKTAVYVSVVIIYATAAGLIFGGIL